jgi:hypothetical protein
MAVQFLVSGHHEKYFLWYGFLGLSEPRIKVKIENEPR